MSAPRIAIVGSFDPAREDELGLKNTQVAAQAGEDLGRELAKQGFQIVVYSSLPHTLEIDVVRGYLSKEEKELGAIQVMYSQRYGEPDFTPDQATDERFEFLPDFNPDWESSFYQSLATVDGVVILGGGPSALIAGLVAMGHKKPVVACAAFGGSGEKVWRALREQAYPLERHEFAQMAAGAWSAELAARLVSLLTR
jgi:ABC-type sugar transport system substrate-binding protein